MPPIEARKEFDRPAAMFSSMTKREATGSRGHGNPPRFEFEEEF